MPAVLSVAHQRSSGWHTFTSSQLPGLFLTGPDKEYVELCAALVSTIKALIVAERGHSAATFFDVRPVPSFKRVQVGSENEATLHFLVDGLD